VTGTRSDSVALRFRDLDAFGHVYHAEYLTLLDELRTAWFGDVLGLDDPQSYVVVRVEIDYVSSLTGDDGSVRGQFAVESAGTTSLTVRESLLAGDGREVARTRVVVVLRDPRTGASRALSDRELASCAAHGVSTGGGTA
jgi:acyl-CoA thioester hydrolase